MIEFRVTGPPGCGKTTYLKEQINRAAATYGGAFVQVCSLTRTAAAQVASVEPSIPGDNIGTLHSLAYRAVGASKIAEAHTKEWNQFAAKHGAHALRLSGEKIEVGEDIVEQQAGDTEGDKMLSEIGRLRNKMRPREFWPSNARAFSQMWDAFKRETKYLDFTDLLEIALKDCAKCPGEPAAFFLDESQDCSRLAFALARKWGEQCLRFVHVGDADQLLFAWAGVDVDAFNRALPREQQRTLHQSYRVPRAVHGEAVKWISRTPGRAPVEYAPRNADGRVRRDVSAKYIDPQNAIRAAVQYLDSGKSVMFCVSCAYMLCPIIAALKAEGLPFHNPYRRRRGDWNPLYVSKGKTSATDRLIAFAKINPAIMGTGNAQMWTNSDVQKFAAWIDSKGAMTAGGKALIDYYAANWPDDPAELGFLLSAFAPECRECVVDGDVEWYARVLLNDKRRMLTYPSRILAKRGYAALKDEPRIVVTTIHAVKGGEADVVFLFPDLSPQGHNEWMSGGDGKEGVRRAFYVGMTRAKEELILCQSSGGMAVAW
jgi:superfamily I DNA/RNA helicase